MYEPNSIHGLLELKKEDVSAGDLLQEVNNTLADLEVWKQQQKQQEDFIQKLQSPKVPAVPEPQEEETLPQVEIKELNLEALKLQPQSKFYIPEPKYFKNSQPQQEFQVENSQLYEAGHKLNQMLSQWSSSLDEFLPQEPKTTAQSEWNKVDEIEKELEELEGMLDSLPKYNN